MKLDRITNIGFLLCCFVLYSMTVKLQRNSELQFVMYTFGNFVVLLFSNFLPVSVHDVYALLEDSFMLF